MSARELRAVNEGYLTATQLVTSIGPALLRIVHAGVFADAALSEVVLYAPGAPEDMGPQSIVLGIGVSADGELRELLRAATAQGAGVVLIKGPIPTGVDPGQTCLVEVTAEASWMHIATTVREQLMDFARASIRGDGASADLFSIANAIYAELGTPVTIEDRHSALIAWSGGQEESDPERIDTILGRAVHRDTLLEQRERGEFAQLHASESPLYIPAVLPGHLPRLAIAVRVGAEVLGYIWAVVSSPLGVAQTTRFAEFAPVVALRLSNLRTETNYARKQRSDLAAAVLSGSASQLEASRLRLGVGVYTVVAAAPRVPSASTRTAESDAALVTDLQRFAETLDYFLTTVHPGSAAVVGTGAVYVIVGWASGAADPLKSSVDLVRGFLSRTPYVDDFVAAVSGPTDTLGGIAQLRAQADVALRALRTPGDSGPAVRTVDQTQLEVMLMHVSDAIDTFGLPVVTGPLRRLREHEGEEGQLVSSLRAYLAAAGSVERAAQTLHVHPNTLRYRMRRICEVSGLDLSDADSLLLAHLQLRVSSLRADAGMAD